MFIWVFHFQNLRKDTVFKAVDDLEKAKLYLIK